MCAEGTSECRQQGETILVAGVQRSRNHRAGLGVGRGEWEGGWGREQHREARGRDGWAERLVLRAESRDLGLDPGALPFCMRSPFSGEAAVEEHGPEWQPSHVIFQLKLLPDKTARLLFTGKGSKLKVQPSPDPDPDPVLGADFKDCVEGSVGERGSLLNRQTLVFSGSKLAGTMSL